MATGKEMMVLIRQGARAYEKMKEERRERYKCWNI
jgi:hypothetical protein